MRIKQQWFLSKKMLKLTDDKSIIAEAATGDVKKETLAQVFSCEFCEISKKTFFTDHLKAIAFLIAYVPNMMDLIRTS